MGKLIEGEWVEGGLSVDETGHFKRNETNFHDLVSREPGARFAPEAGRYRLYVSYACPWAHRTLLVRALKGLEEVIPISVVHPFMGNEGWTFDTSDPDVVPDPDGASLLREIYLRADPKLTARVTVPIFWDTQEQTIVNNESREILRFLDHEFDDLAERPIDLAPPDLLEEIEETIDAIYEPINNGVYRCGFAGTQEAYEEDFDVLFEALHRWDRVLGERRYLCGERLTEADLCMIPTLFRFDPVYYVHFKCNLKLIREFRHLSGYLREICRLPGISSACNLRHIKEHYYGSHESVNPTRFVARGPEMERWLAEPHGRDFLPGGPPPELFG